MKRTTEFQEGYLNADLPQYAGDPEFLRKIPVIDFRHGATPIHQSQNDEWANDYRGPSEQ
jgi:hypothetical protein